ncbi:MAG: ABC transporter permease, partial [Sinobacteraceae bacterium]|nr:ABC transporter permease [Nevskiaceae bacterium]
FGVLLAVGFTKAHLLGLVFAEAAILCLLGAAVGNGIAAGASESDARKQRRAARFAQLPPS